MEEEFDYKDHAKQLSETLVDMVAHLIQKHNQNILEEMHAQIKKKNAEIAKLKAIVGGGDVQQMPDLSRCRENLRLSGEPYPRSNCDLCGSLLNPGRKCLRDS